MAARRGQLVLFEGPRITRRTRRSSDDTLRALRKLGRVEPADAALVAMLRTLADLIDAELAEPEPNKWTVARLVSEWRIIHGELRDQTAVDDFALMASFFDDPARVGSHPG